MINSIIRKTAFSAVLALGIALSASAQQDILRYNYLRNGNTYTGAERMDVPGSTPLQLKLSRVTFSDGFAMYVLRIDYQDATPWKMPLNATFTANLSDGGVVILKNEGKEPNEVAPQGVKTAGGKIFWNYGLYYVEEADIIGLTRGVVDIEAVQRWSSDGKIRVAYKNNEFSTAIKKQYDAIKKAQKPSVKVTNQIRSISDLGGNRYVETNKVDVGGQASVALVYLYYAESNSESYDLNLYIPGKTVPLGNQVVITTASGEQISLQQEKELSAGRVICYPEPAQIKSMVAGIRKLTVGTVTSAVDIPVDGAAFGKAMDELYNALQTATIL